MKRAIRVGSPVLDRDFFGRKQEIADLREYLTSGQHILMRSPRRVGKTSLIHATTRELRAAGWMTVIANVETGASEGDFFRSLITSLKTEGAALPFLGRLAASVGRSVKKVDVKGVTLDLEAGLSLQKEFSALLDELIKQGRRVLLAVDELPVLLIAMLNRPEGKERVASLLHWLREERQRRLGNPVWLLCGSVGLDTFAEQQRLTPAINDLRLFPLGEFTEAESNECAEALAADNGIKLSPGVVEAISKSLGWRLPYHLQLVMDELHKLSRQQHRVIVPSDVADIIASLSSAQHRMRFVDWQSRLALQLPPERARAAEMLLGELSRQPEGCDSPRLLAILMADQPGADPVAVSRLLLELLGMLERDGYLVRRDSGKIAFRSLLLREYWRTNEPA